MAYPPRIIKTGATYFVTSRCINFEPFLGTDAVKEIVLNSITKTQKRYNFEISSFGIMDNQLRMMIRTTDERHTISRILQLMKSLITRDVNRKMFRSGTIWNERFFCEIIDTAKEAMDELKTMILYAMYNPALSGADADPRKNRYNSIFSYTGEGYSPGISITPHPSLKRIWKTADTFFSGFVEYETKNFLCRG